MGYDQAILDAFTAHETALRFDEWACTRPGPPEETSAHRALSRAMVKRARLALFEMIAVGVEYEGIGATAAPAKDGAQS